MEKERRNLKNKRHLTRLKKLKRKLKNRMRFNFKINIRIRLSTELIKLMLIKKMLKWLTAVILINNFQISKLNTSKIRLWMKINNSMMKRKIFNSKWMNSNKNSHLNSKNKITKKDRLGFKNSNKNSLSNNKRWLNNEVNILMRKKRNAKKWNKSKQKSKRHRDRMLIRNFKRRIKFETN